MSNKKGKDFKEVSQVSYLKVIQILLFAYATEESSNQEADGLRFIMVIGLSGVQFGL